MKPAELPLLVTDDGPDLAALALILREVAEQLLNDPARFAKKPFDDISCLRLVAIVTEIMTDGRLTLGERAHVEAVLAQLVRTWSGKAFVAACAAGADHIEAHVAEQHHLAVSTLLPAADANARESGRERPIRDTDDES